MGQGRLIKLEMIENGKARCTGRATAENIIAKMNAIKQNDTLEKICNEVANHTIKMQADYLNNKIRKQTRSAKHIRILTYLDILLRPVFVSTWVLNLSYRKGPSHLFTD